MGMSGADGSVLAIVWKRERLLNLFGQGANRLVVRTHHQHWRFLVIGSVNHVVHHPISAFSVENRISGSKAIAQFVYKSLTHEFCDIDMLRIFQLSPVVPPPPLSIFAVFLIPDMD